MITLAIMLLQESLPFSFGDWFIWGPLGSISLLLAWANYIQYKRNNKLQDAERETAIKVTELVTKTLTTLESSQTNTKDLHSDTKELYSEIKQVVVLLKQHSEHFNKLPDLTFKIDQLLIKLNSK